MAFSKISGKGIDVSTDIITEFNSTGIDDNATSTAITIAANNSVSIPNLHGNTTTIGNLTVGGDFIVQGNNFTVDADSLRVEDSLIQLAANNESSDVIDIGFFGHYSNDGNTALHTGFFRDASDEQYYLFNGLEDANLDANNSVTTIDRSGTGFTLADLNVSRLIATTESTRDILKLDAGSNNDGWLEINADTTVGRIRAFSNAYATSFLQNSVSLETADDLSLIAYSADSNIKFHTGGFPGGGGASFERMRIDSAGNVGIGTTSPNAYTNYTTLTLNGATSSALDFEGGGTLMAEVVATANDLILQTVQSDGELIFRSAAGSEAMRIDSSGRVQIGTTSTYNSYADNLVVEDDSNAGITIATTDTTARTSLYFADGASVGADQYRGIIEYRHNSDKMYFWTNATDHSIVIDGDGNVGIGAASPARTLDVSSGATGVAITTKGSGIGSYITFQDGTTTNDAKVRVGAVGDNLTLFGGGSERMRIDSSGDISIGSVSNHSGARIVINDTPPTAFGSPMLQVGQETFTASGYYSIGLGYTAGSYTEPPAEIAAVSTSSSGGTTADIVFGTRSVTTNTAVTERMRIDSSGNVGIGTASTGAIRFSSVTPTANHIAAQIENTNTADSFALVVKGGNDANDYTADFRKRDNTNIMRIRGDGNIGIGETAPAAKLQITGTGDLLRLESTNAGTSGAQLDLIHFSASPANDDTVGVINFGGRDAGLNATQYASIKGVSQNISSEYGELQLGIRTDSSTFYHNKAFLNITGFEMRGDVGDAGYATLKLRSNGGANDLYSGVAFYSTFGSYPADQGPRRSADIWSGFTGTWNTEFLAFGVGNAGSSNDAQNQTDEKMRILSTGVVKAAESYKFNLVTVVSYNNSTQNTVQTGMNNQVFLISIHHSAGVSAILCLPNGGSGVAYDFQMTDPDSGTISNTNSVSFTMAGTGGNTFTAQILGGSGNVVVQRTSGSGSYTVYINQILGGLV